MAHTYRWATPTVTVELLDAECQPAQEALVNVDKLVLTLTQEAHQLVKTLEDVTVDPETAVISCELSQEETAAFKTGSGLLQLNVLYTDGRRGVSARASFQVRKNDYDKEMA